MKWFARDRETDIRNDEVARSHLGVDQLKPYWTDYKKVFATHNGDSEKEEIGKYVFLLGVLDHAMNLLRVRYEIFLDRLYELFENEGIEEIVTEIFIEFHINRECSHALEKVFLEGRNQFTLWNELSDKSIYDWKDAFIKHYILESDYPQNIQSFYLLVNKTDVKADYMTLSLKKTGNHKEFQLPENSYYDDIIDLQ